MDNFRCHYIWRANNGKSRFIFGTCWDFLSQAKVSDHSLVLFLASLVRGNADQAVLQTKMDLLKFYKTHSFVCTAFYYGPKFEGVLMNRVKWCT